MFGFLVLIMAVVACGKKKAAGSLERVVKCKYTEDSRTVQCAAADADACQQLPEQVLCRGPYLDVLQGQINNWKKQGVWSGYENKITWIDLPGIDEPTSHDGKMCWKASLNADVWLCPAKPGAATGRLVGYGRLLHYEQNMMTDDLQIEVLETFSGAAEKQERAFRDLSGLGSDKNRIQAWLSGPAAVGLDASAVRSELLLAGVSPHELMAAASSQQAQAQASASAAQQDTARRETEAAPANYPAPCAKVDAKTHTVVDGADGLCVPQGEGILVASLLAAKSDAVQELPSPPSSYDDDDPVAIMRGPESAIGEKSTLSAAERMTAAAKTRAKVFAEIKSASSWGEWKWVGAAGKLTGVLDLESSRLTQGEPSVQRKQKCETASMSTCGGRCDDDGDCMKILSLCGCPESVCNPIFHFCTGCPAERHCEDPEFPMNVPKMTLSAVFTKPEQTARAKRAADGSYGLLLTRISGAWRQVFTAMEEAAPGEKPERKVEFDSGYYARIAPMGFFLLACDDARCGRTAEQLVSLSAAPWSITIGDNPRVEVRCQDGSCKGKVAK